MNILHVVGLVPSYVYLIYGALKLVKTCINKNAAFTLSRLVINLLSFI